MIDKGDIWLTVLALGAGSYLLRFVFIGLVGDRPMPAWLLRHLRYTAVAVLPALIAPMVLWPPATGGAIDLPRLAAAAAATAVAWRTHSVIGSILAGGGTLYLGLWLVG
ncbi:AzlD domain-containing protein [Roseovarius spongiae]|uniref:AzlD domain-containing protein n=1 Tax=Roseovarius spongiae TaxID=2320272 RepID=A0A3A8AT07_9RHOB|nr:AzlD domain-containing protein [Roseovarius spongiae]RKF14634.1 AzlD domain-containing protein [Roseovarius spongiae]